MGGIGGLGNDTVLQLWAEAREDWNDTVAQVGWCTAARDMWRHRRKENSGVCHLGTHRHSFAGCCSGLQRHTVTAVVSLNT